jgi:hypothetical protein
MKLTTESVATVLELNLSPIIERWMKLVDTVPEISNIALSYDERSGYLPQLLEDLITRLRLKGYEQPSPTAPARDHGKVRFDQGYSVSMLVEESRLLQVSIFDILRLNQENLDVGLIMADVTAIADECDVQLKHTVAPFLEFEKLGNRPAA